jgi:hypothetical protein
MKYPIPLAIAATFLVLPFSAHAQTSVQDTSTSQAINATSDAQTQATRMVPAQGALLADIDAKKDQQGKTFQVRLVKKVRLQDGTELPSGTILVGQITQDDTQITGTTKLALRITEAQPKGGSALPIKATIVGLAAPETEDAAGHSVMPGEQDNNTWTDKTVAIDQIDALPHEDLHSNIASRNSGVLVSDKDDVKLKKGSEIMLAINSASTNSQSDSTTGTSSNQ